MGDDAPTHSRRMLGPLAGMLTLQQKQMIIFCYGGALRKKKRILTVDGRAVISPNLLSFDWTHNPKTSYRMVGRPKGFRELMVPGRGLQKFPIAAESWDGKITPAEARAKRRTAAALERVEAQRVAW